ncbi:uncharacterized protein PpBr36_11211 [Pyricularia pennisetigena]|uniref:uncharacterized protein n=1 Tax=Pyricularia pennisetigena TaxID=1578925 RepID=UPI001151C2F9|nr:uncharacterized protein PpBr36_11211 [Pyricularia pennisetigena]TLS20396.1 hypothetical protein PpBr36_11211 [Pyricularia pennisetigena]
MGGRRVVICAYYGSQDQNPPLSTDKWATRLGSYFFERALTEGKDLRFDKITLWTGIERAGGPGATCGSAIIGITRGGVLSKSVYKFTTPACRVSFTAPGVVS